ncbi:MAG: glycosyltransferase family 4 protein [Deinococcales bacterium]
MGGYGHTPNVQAIKYFVKEVMPLLTKEDSRIKFYVYGSRMPEAFEELASEQVLMEGFVDDLDAMFERHRVFVVPLLSGAGIKGKVLESMAHGLPSVTSPIAIEGTGLTHKINTLVAEHPLDWVKQITKLYHDEILWSEISKTL